MTDMPTDLRKRRLWAGYNMSEVARLANVSAGTVDRVERGHGKPESITKVSAVIERLFVETNARLEGREPPWYKQLMEGQSPP